MEEEKEFIDILIGLEPVFKKAGELALKMRGTATSKKKFNTGNPVYDIVTEADSAVQEFILSEMAKTKLVDCKLFAEEETESTKKFNGKNGLVLTLDPIDGTLVYSSTGRFWSTIVSLKNGKEILYTFLYYPVLDWSRRIVEKKVEDSGDFPVVKIKENLNLDFSKVIYCHNLSDVNPEIYEKLTKGGYKFCTRDEITDERGSYILIFSGVAAGSYVKNPNPYDGLVALHYGKSKNYEIVSDIDLEKPRVGDHGPYYEGWYLVFKK